MHEVKGNGNIGSKEKISREPIFGAKVKENEKLEEKEAIALMYEDVKRFSDKTERREDVEWMLQMKCIQEWFIRSSWINKFLFLEVLCRSTDGCYVIEQVLRSIESIFCKDVVESLTNQSTDYDYDRIITDDNRALDSAKLKETMKENFFWFMGLEPTFQTLTILRLLRLGGGGLVFTLYKLLQNLYQERESVAALISTVSNLVPRVTNTSKQKPNSKSQFSKQSTDASLEGEQGEISGYTQKKQEELERRDGELLQYQKSKGIVSDDRITKKAEETVDLIQIMPIWLNRRIMSYINEKTLPGLKRVGKYWGKMIDESINEKTGRKAINAKINKIVGRGKVKKEEEIEKTEKQDEPVEEMGKRELIRRKRTSEKEMSDGLQVYDVVFCKKSQFANMDASYFPERQCVFDNVTARLACSNANNTVNFYSIKTGARLCFSVRDFESPITSLALHEDRVHVIVGCSDGSLISRDIRTNKKNASFNGHTKAVKSLITTPSKLLSASEDNTIKYFQLWSGLCLLRVDLNPEFTASCMILKQQDPGLLVVGTKEGVLILLDLVKKQYVSKLRVHNTEILNIAQDENILITGSKGGRIRLWDAFKAQLNESPLNPFYDIDLKNPVLCLLFHKNQIFAGCENGTIKIISLLTGSINKTLKISFQAPILGLAISEDKVSLKLIIWHEGGIEMRTFSLQKLSFNKKSVRGKNNRESKQKAPTGMKKNKISEMVLAGLVRNSQGIIEVTPNAYKRTTFLGVKKPLKERCCTLFTLRNRKKNVREMKKNIFLDFKTISKVVGLNESGNECVFPCQNGTFCTK